MVMPVSWPIDRLLCLAAVVAMAGAASLAPEAHAQRQEPAKRTQAQKPPPAPAKPAGKPMGPKQAAAAQAAKLDAAGPSQIGTTTIARYAYMIDANTGAILLSKDADKPMAPSSMAKMM